MDTYFNYNFSDADAKEFAKCEMYDLSSLSINSNFDIAYSNRNLDTMKKVSCASSGLPLIDQFEFDRTEGISSIVTDVRFFHIHKFCIPFYVKNLRLNIYFLRIINSRLCIVDSSL